MTEAIERLLPLLSLLGFDRKWLEYGFLDAETLVQMTEDQRVSDDTSAEHYRYAAFRAILQNHESLHDKEIARYIELATIDVDRAMSDAALADLLRWRGLTTEQFERLRAQPNFAVPYLQKIAQRRQLRQELRATLTEEIFARCLASADVEIQYELISRTDISREQLTRLSQQGSNRAVRNLAQLRLSQREHQESAKETRT